MILELANPKNAVNLVAGVISIVFEKLNGETPFLNGHMTKEADDLTQINGIGPTFAQRLNAAGIITFADLAEQTPEYIRLVAHVESWQGDPKAWIDEAKKLQ